jgi:hypothetical protein
MAVIISGNNTPTAGSVIYGDGTTLTPTATGTAGQVLTSAGSGAPTWSTPSTGALTLVGTYTPTGSATVDFAFTGGYTSYMIIATGVQFSNIALINWTSDNFATLGNFQIVGYTAFIPGGGSALNGGLASGNYFFGTGIQTPGANNRINFNLTAQNVNSTTLYKTYNGLFNGYVDFVGYNRECMGALSAYGYSTGVTTAINGMRLSTQAGASANIRGTFKVYGIS